MKRAILLCALYALSAAAAERWSMQYFYDAPDDSEFVITSLAFPTAERGLAAGHLDTGKKDKPYAVSTGDGGRTWQPVRVPDSAISLFFLNVKAGWLVGPDGIWHTANFGETWNKLGRAPGAVRVWFRDEQKGWAVGVKKSVYETSDGGANWKPVPTAAEPKAEADHTTYNVIAFATPEVGLICGWSRPPRRGEAEQPPAWADPDRVRREWPSTSLLLQTTDAGAHWKSSETSMFGQITQVSMAPNGIGLSLIEFFDRFDYPSEVYQIDLRSSKSVRAFRARNRAVTDVLVPVEGPAYLASVEPPGTLAHSPVPGKLKLLKSSNLTDWEEMAADYRAVGRRAVLAAAGLGHVWVATDTGMILTLAAE